jgi:hypothetical protein
MKVRRSTSKLARQVRVAGRGVVNYWSILEVIRFLTDTFAVLHARKQMFAKSSDSAGADSLDRNAHTADGNRAAITDSNGVFRVTAYPQRPTWRR